MARVLVLYHSVFGPIEAMAEAEAEGARSFPGTTVDLKRVPDPTPERGALGRAAPVATIDDLLNYDAIIVGCGSRYGRMAWQMAQFLDQAGELWARGALNGKVGAAFASTATQHAGQETTLFSIITNLMHLGLVVVGLPNSFAGQSTLKEITGGTPYGATTITGGHGERTPSENELAAARFQGRLVAETADRLHGASTHDRAPGPSAPLRSEFQCGDVVARETGKGAFQVEVFAGGARILVDEPPEVGGDGAGPTPFDLLSAALGACTAMTLRIYARRKGWPLGKVRVKVGHAKEPAMTPPDQFSRLISIEGELSADEQAKLLDIANRCPVHRTLTSGSGVTSIIGPPDAELPAAESPIQHELDAERAADQA